MQRSVLTLTRIIAALLPCIGTLSVGAGDPAEKPASHQIAGWNVWVNPCLQQRDQSALVKALELLQRQLSEIIRVVPSRPLARLREVPLFFSPAYPNTQPKAEYHPDAAWLRENGRDPVMVKAVEFTNVPEFEKETDRMPHFVLHELAHAYHDRVLEDGFANREIKKAFDQAIANKSYDRVERFFGTGRTNTFERAYAATSPMEYFAECTEAFFGRNDFYPFTSAELKKHDPAMFELLQKIWQTPSTP